jgi:hypothetical protein
MTLRRIPLALCCATALFVAACSDETSSPGTSTTVAETTTTVAETTTTVAETTTTVAETTTTEATTTTSTIPVVEGLQLSGAGLGDALFGADDEGVIDYVTSILGAPVTDTGWQDPASIGAVCPGSEIRFVDWNDLSLFFTDDSGFASGVRHFAGFTYGPPFGTTMNPFGLETEAGVGFGSTVAEIRAAYPSASINPDDGFSGNTFIVGDGLYGFLTGVTDADTVVAVLAGNGCGE